MTKKEREEKRREEYRLQREAYKLQLFEQNKEDWTKRVLLVISESRNSYVSENLEGFIVEFYVTVGHEYFIESGYLPVNLELTDDIETNIFRLENFEYRIKEIIKERKEAEKKENLRKSAIAKLTEDERKALGV